MNIQKLIQLDKQKKGKDALDAEAKEVIYQLVLYFFFLHFFLILLTFYSLAYRLKKQVL